VEYADERGPSVLHENCGSWAEGLGLARPFVTLRPGNCYFDTQKQHVFGVKVTIPWICALLSPKRLNLGKVVAVKSMLITTEYLFAAQRLTPPDEAEKDLWEHYMDDHTGQVFWLPRQLSEAYHRQQMGLRGLVSVFGKWMPTDEDKPGTGAVERKTGLVVL